MELFDKQKQKKNKKIGLSSHCEAYQPTLDSHIMENYQSSYIIIGGEH